MRFHILFIWEFVSHKFQNENLHFYVDCPVYNIMRIYNFNWPSHLFGKIQNVNVHFMLTVLLIIWWEFAILTDRSMYKYWELANLADRPIDLGNFNIIICTFMYLFIIWWEFAILADRPYKIEINIDDFEWLCFPQIYDLDAVGEKKPA